MESYWPALAELVPILAIVALSILLFWMVLRVLASRGGAEGGHQFARQMTLLVLTCVGTLAVILVSPMTENTRNRILGILGLVITAVIALSSTTFVANVMAGFMLRSVRSFRLGDFISVGHHFGRVTERGLFHVEIQTEDSDLITLPNLYLASQPLHVVRAAGTFVACEVSLGYDAPHGQIEPLLLRSAEAAELRDPFVRVIELGNFSVTYRVAGFLDEVKKLLSVRSILRKRVLDVLHGAGVEIVSPAFMIQRRQEPGFRVIPNVPVGESEVRPAAWRLNPEDRVFDKAEKAERLVQSRAEREEIRKTIKGLEDRLDAAGDKEKTAMERDLQRLRWRLDKIEETLKAEEEEPSE